MSLTSRVSPARYFYSSTRRKQRPVTEYHYADNKNVVGVAEESKTQYAVNNQGRPTRLRKTSQTRSRRVRRLPERTAARAAAQTEGTEIIIPD